MKYEVTRLASQHLDEIADYTAEHWDETQALAYVSALEAAFGDIAARPERGRIDKRLPRYRRYRVRAHVIYYRVEVERIVIAAVLHKRQLPQLHVADDR